MTSIVYRQPTDRGCAYCYNAACRVVTSCKTPFDICNDCFTRHAWRTERSSPLADPDKPVVHHHDTPTLAIRKALKRLERGWTQHQLYLWSFDETPMPTARGGPNGDWEFARACAWCANAAISAADPKDGTLEAHVGAARELATTLTTHPNAAALHLPARPHYIPHQALLAAYNDHSERTHADVLDLFRRTLRRRDLQHQP